MIVTLRTRSTLIIPQEVRRELALEPGSSLDLRVERGRLILTPIGGRERSIRLSASGVAKEAAADADIDAGRVTEYASSAALLEDLERQQ
jgi:bifunctional DNA-binding transcriptional regulator/antitoxin component of YhaV-PrlF toxin-antitoxin module